MTPNSYYEILGISSSATPDEIRYAHRSLVRLYHPDSAGDGRGDSQQFSEIQEAYEVLSNADQRRKYDVRLSVLRAEDEKAAKRHPPKISCSMCGSLVYATQRRLHLGRFMCQRCFDSRSKRVGKIVQLMTMAEFKWRLKTLRVQVRAHISAIVLTLVVLVFASARIAKMVSLEHSRNEPPTEVTDRPLVRPPQSSASGRTPSTRPGPETRFTSLDQRTP